MKEKIYLPTSNFTGEKSTLISGLFASISLALSIFI